MYNPPEGMELNEPTPHSSHALPDDALKSWRAIADHFGVTIRTVQLWETERGLPVHRMPGVKGRVYAYPHELDAWAGKPSSGSETPAEAKPEARNRRAPSWALLVALTAAAALALLGWGLRPRPQPVSWIVEGPTLTITGAKGETLWRHDFPQPVFRSWLDRPKGLHDLRTMPTITDLDGDGTQEVVVSYRTEPLEQGTSELYCFEADGRLRWRFTPGREVETVQRRFAPPYDIRIVLAAPASQGKRPVLIVVSNHRTSFPTQVVALSPQGKILSEYWHSGHILHVDAGDLENDGRTELYLAAVDHATNSGEVLVLDPERFGGAATESDPAYKLLHMAAADKVARVLLPSTQLGRQLGAVANPLDIRVVDGKVVVSVAQAEAIIPESQPPSVDFHFGPAMKLIKTEYAPTFKFALEKRVRQGRAQPYDIEADLERLKEVEIVSPWRKAAPKPGEPRRR